MHSRDLQSEQGSPWKEFWSDQTTFDNDLLKRSIDVFLEHTETLMDYSPGDKVLDVGCGPGFLLEALAPRVQQVCGLDVSEKYVSECRGRLSQFGNVRVEQLGEDYTDLSFLGDQTFDKIICLSVVQYYRQKSDVRALMAAVKGVATPGARFLIADISVETGLFADILSLLRSALRERMFKETLRLLGRAQFGKYARLRRSVGLLQFDREELVQMARAENLEAELITSRLTVNENRSHIMIRM